MLAAAAAPRSHAPSKSLFFLDTTQNVTDKPTHHFVIMCKAPLDNCNLYKKYRFSENIWTNIWTKIQDQFGFPLLLDQSLLM